MCVPECVCLGVCYLGVCTGPWVETIMGSKNCWRVDRLSSRKGGGSATVWISYELGSCLLPVITDTANTPSLPGMPRCSSLRVKPNCRLKQRSRFSSTATRSKRKSSCKRALPPHISPVSPASLDSVWFGPTSVWFGDLEIPYDTTLPVTTPTPSLPPELQLFSDEWAAEEEEEARVNQRCWMQR